MAELNVARGDLRDKLEEFGERMNRHRTHEARYPGDLSMFGFLAHAWQHATAAYHLADPENFGTALFANARASFEAAQDALYLATAPDYLGTGARIRAFERLEFADIGFAVAAAFPDDPEPEPVAPDADPYADVRASILSDAERWEKKYPGNGDILRRALDDLAPQFLAARSGKARHPGHWSGKSRRTMAREIEERVNEPGLATNMTTTYSSLSRGAHPRFRGEEWERAKGSAPAHRFATSVPSVALAVQFTEVAVGLAIHAFDLVHPSPPEGGEPVSKHEIGMGAPSNGTRPNSG